MKNEIKKTDSREIKEKEDVENLKTVAKYSVSSIVSYIIEIILFTFFNTWFSKYIGLMSIIASTVIARTASSMFNYFLNSRLVFSQYSSDTMLKYYIMVLIQMCNSAIFVTLLSLIFTASSATMVKICVDFFIFFVNYLIQKKYIFDVKEK